MSITALKHKIKKNDKLKRIIHFLIMKLSIFLQFTKVVKTN